MEFTIKGYSGLLRTLKQKSYQFVGFNETEYPKDCIIMRHDIDCSLAQAEKLSCIEADEGVSSTWLVLLNTDFYNVFSRKSRQHIRMLQKNGGKIGLHFDETQYAEILEPLKKNALEKYETELCGMIKKEASILSQIIQAPVEAVSFHRPSKEAIALSIELPGVANAYGQQFFRYFKYLSDSDMRWRESIDEIIENKQYSHFQILTHPIWYSDRVFSKHDHLLRFCKQASLERYQSLSANISDLSDVLSKAEVV